MNKNTIQPEEIGQWSKTEISLLEMLISLNTDQKQQMKNDYILWSNIYLLEVLTLEYRITVGLGLLIYPAFPQGLTYSTLHGTY